MPTKKALLVLLLGTLALPACTPMRWQKPGGDDGALAGDLAACRKLAQDRFRTAGAPGMTNTDPRFGAPGPSQADVRMQEGQAEGVCMRGKGYVLVEDRK